METRTVILRLLFILISAASAYPQAAVRINNANGVVSYPVNLWSANAADIASALSLASTYQPLNAKLMSLSSVTFGADTTNYFTSATTVASTPLTSFARSILDDTNQAAVRTTLGLTPGTDVQAQNALLQTLAGYPGQGLFTVQTGTTSRVATIMGTGTNIIVANGNGVAGNPTIDVGANIPKVASTNNFTGINTYSYTSTVSNSNDWPLSVSAKWNPAADDGVYTHSGFQASNFKQGNFNGSSGLSMAGIYGDAGSESGTGSIARVSGVFGRVRNYGSGSSITHGAALWAGLSSATAGTTFTNCYGLYIERQKNGTIANGYGVYQADAGDANYFGGPVTVNSNITGNGTVNSLPNQTDSGTSSIMTRNLTDARVANQFAASEYAVSYEVPFAASDWTLTDVSGFGTAMTVPREIQNQRTATSGNYALWQRNTPGGFVNVSSGALLVLDAWQGFIIRGRVMAGRDNTLQRFCFHGVDGATEAKNVGSLNRMGMAVEFQQVAGVLQARVLVYTSTGLMSSSWTNFSPSLTPRDAFWLLRRNSDVALYYRTNLAGGWSSTPLITVAGVPGGTIGSANWTMSVYDVNSGTPPSAGFFSMTMIQETNGIQP